MTLSPDQMKQQAAQAALRLVEDGMVLGLGTGSTAYHFVAGLAERVAQGLTVRCVPTSEATRQQALAAHIPLVDLDEVGRLDLTVDGADEVDSALRLIKGGGAALLREKIVAAASEQMVVIADQSKFVSCLGAFALPVEVNIFAHRVTARMIEEVIGATGHSASVTWRRRTASSDGPRGEHGQAQDDQQAVITDGGHYIYDCALSTIHEPEALATALNAIPGVVEHGLFINLCTQAFIADGTSVQTLSRP